MLHAVSIESDHWCQVLTPECGYEKHCALMQSGRLNNNEGALLGNVPWVKKLILTEDL